MVVVLAENGENGEKRWEKGENGPKMAQNGAKTGVFGGFWVVWGGVRRCGRRGGGFVVRRG